MSDLELSMMKRVGELNAEINLLRYNLERLRKAGDRLEQGLRTLPGDYPRCLANEWTAARDGKPSA